MRLADYYEMLLHSYPEAMGSSVSLGHEELMETWKCTKQNVRYLLRSMEEAGWVTWSPGRGRGNKSRLTLCVSKDEFLYTHALRLFERDRTKDALSWISRADDAHQNRFLANLRTHLGFHTEKSGEARVDVLRLFMHSPYGTLDPARVFFAREIDAIKDIFEPIVRYDRESEQFLPNIAHHWETDSSGLIWTFHLRKGIRFHNGAILTAEDVEFTMNRIRFAMDSPYRWLFSLVDDVKVLTPHALQVVTHAPFPLLLHCLAAPPAWVVPKGVYAVDEPNPPVGCGPFQVSQYDDKMYVLEAYPDYFRERPHLDKVETYIIPKTQFHEAYGDSEFDIVGVDGADRAQDPNRRRQRFEIPFTQYVSINLNRPGRPQTQRAFREALRYAIQKQAMIRELGGNRDAPSNGFIFGWDAETERDVEGDVERDLERGPAKANQLLSSIGYDGEPVSLYTFRRTENVEDARWIQQKCREVGIPIHIHTIHANDILNPEVVKSADLVMKGDLEEEDPVFSLLRVFQSDHSVIRQHLDERLEIQVQQMLSKLYRAKSTHEQTEWLHRLEQMIRDETAAIFLYREYYHASFTPYLEGIPTHLEGRIRLKDLWMKPM